MKTTDIKIAADIHFINLEYLNFGISKTKTHILGINGISRL